jgi:enamine deaminase RidA (YjgF/YER057c/UK114 family)
MSLEIDEAARTPPASGPPGDVLVTVQYGGAPAPSDGAPGLVARIPNRPLSPGPAREVWRSAGTVAPVEIEGARAVADDRSAFVAVEADAASGTAIDSLSFEIYERMLRGVARAGYPHLLRVWNYLPQIHDVSSGIERYMVFCKGRSEAFAAHYGVSFPDRLPAASAVGCPGDTLVVHLLASREPGRHIENPRQVPAFRYPERYGPKSPSFARGTVAPSTWEGAVFVSGTASIVGHESLFPGDPARQTVETMRNIEAVLDAADVPGRGGPLGSRLDALRVYVRFPGQQEAIRSEIVARTRTAVPTTWIQAEVCREELLVEIEAIAHTRRT